MATEQVNFRRFKLTSTVLIALLSQFLGTNPLDEVPALLHHVVYCIAEHFFGKLPGIILALVQTPETYTFTHAGLVSIVQVLAQF